MLRRIAVLLILLMAVVVSGCVVNPVTGSSELAIIPESQEIQIGRENYLPSRQLQGGDYVTVPGIEAYVNEVGQKLVKVSDRKLPYEFVVLNNSVPNAWALPGGKIAVNRGLLVELESEAELAAVLGHEIVHAAARHGAKNIERGMLLQGAVLAAGLAVRGESYNNLAVGGAQLAAGLVQQKYGRDAELESDFYGMQYMARAGYDPMAAVRLQETFVRLNSKGAPNWLEGLFASHPPSEERVAVNRRTASQLPAGGRLEQERYRQAISSLLKTKEAYAAYDKGREAIGKKDYPQAIALAAKAKAAEPREGHFYALNGDALLAQGLYRRAEAEYDLALQANDNFFYYYLQRGIARTKSGNPGQAEADLKKSVSLLPTATAFNLLGNMSLASGSIGQAKQYFLAAADSGSADGLAARSSLARLEMPENPGKYIAVELGLNNKGMLIARLTNRSPLPVRHVEIVIVYPDESGRQRQQGRQLAAILQPGEIVMLNTGFGPYQNQNVLQHFRAGVVKAMLVNE